MNAVKSKKTMGENEQPESNGATTIKECKDEKDPTISDTKRRKKFKCLARVLLFLPYIVGLFWTCLHPIVSVITGEMKCRGWYLDEHSIETRFIDNLEPHILPPHLENLEVSPVRQPKYNGIHSLCDFFPMEGDPGFNPSNLICHSHGDYFEVAMIMPLSNAIDATEEAVVMVIPSPEETNEPSDTEEAKTSIDWSSSIFHQGMIQTIKHLADPGNTPWLAKAVLVVTPTLSSDGTAQKSLDETVSSFISAYLGEDSPRFDYQSSRQPQNHEKVPPMPTKLSGSILRNLIVLQAMHNAEVDRTGRHISKSELDLSISPQGRRGVLPNADLFFLVSRLMERTMFFRQSPYQKYFTHPCTQESRNADFWMTQWIKKLQHRYRRKAEAVKEWAMGMVDTFLFARTLAVGPFPPHAAALERGIDSLTVHATFGGIYRRDPVLEFVQYSEYIVRSLANLHERLHHSFTLYLLPTPKTFVSHIEYLLPNLLVLLPLAVRVFGILLPAMKGGLDLTAVLGVLLILSIVVVAMLLADVALNAIGNEGAMTGILAVLYTGVAYFWIHNILFRERDQDQSDNHEMLNEQDEGLKDASPSSTRTVRTLQFVACAMAVYILVPIAFANASLAYLPSVLWSAILAFPDYASMKKSVIGRTSFQKHVVIPVLGLLVFATAPPVLLVPRLFPTYTVFVKFAYVPIHVLFSLLMTSVLVSR
ncbi:unnamed protein product [Pseudo-nitzschia multistriata]|uniref:Uncharacterized protein n=1 Tax=Pseudo-nitzschia multistriata TaxID=183589 RepID=A0A448ZEN1_9STRA|nr:unnamed protein product [Pseudo-nitzschia multistriata]